VPESDHEEYVKEINKRLESIQKDGTKHPKYAEKSKFKWCLNI